MPGPIRAHVRVMERLADWAAPVAVCLIALTIGVLLPDVVARAI